MHIEYYIERLTTALSIAEERGVDLHIEIAITNDTTSIHSQETKVPDEVTNEKKQEYAFVVEKSSSVSSDTSSSLRISSEDKGCCCNNPSGLPSPCCVTSTSDASRAIVYSYSRPSVAAFIRGPVEVTGGETSVAVCGGKSLVADVRNSVVALSDERAVHKGTGAQGIHLHVEEYCF